MSLIVVLFGLVGLCAGTGAGRGARVLVGRLRRGARVRPPWCEAVLGVSWAACGGLWAAGTLPARWLPLLLGLSWLAVAAGTVDLASRRLPDALTVPALPVALLLTAPVGGPAVGRAAAGAAVLFLAHLLVRLVEPAALGAGDVKLAAPVGAALGAVSWTALVLGAALAALATALAALATMGPAPLAGRVRGTAALPHGPSMLGAGWLVVVSAASGAVGPALYA
jgi:leader peptidase (prepilin peptidase)/N-methyltransferase